MMIDRINSLCARLTIPGTPVLKLESHLDEDNHVRYTSLTPTHDFIDKIDKHAGIITRFDRRGDLAQVGERVRRLERHLDNGKVPPYFWVGAEAEDMALTG